MAGNAKIGKRRDDKGRNLRTGESQRPDGRYMYQYKGIDGKRHTIYNSDLLELRKEAKQIQKDLDDNIDTKGAEITLNAQFKDKVVALNKSKWKISTLENYKSLWEHHVKNDIGKKRLCDIKNSTLEAYFQRLANEKKFSMGTIKIIYNLIYNCFKKAVADDILRKNFCEGALNGVNAKVKIRHELTVEQQNVFIDFVSQSNRYMYHLPLFTVALGTGMRAGELCGLRWCDVDLKKRIIDVSHSLSYKPIDGVQQFYVGDTKTANGKRQIPMLDDVYSQLLKQKQYLMAMGIKGDYEVDGYSNFIFLTKAGKPYSNVTINHFLIPIIKACNEWEAERAKKERREPVVVPHFSIHNLRHTFCTRLCTYETNLKAIQEIMGHGNIKTTMDIYAHTENERTKNAMDNLNGKIKIS